MTLPLSDPAVKEMLTCASPAVADNKFGADGPCGDGAVGVTVTDSDATLSPMALTALRRIQY